MTLKKLGKFDPSTYRVFTPTLTDEVTQIEVDLYTVPAAKNAITSRMMAYSDNNLSQIQIASTEGAETFDEGNRLFNFTLEEKSTFEGLFGITMQAGDKIKIRVNSYNSLPLDFEQVRRYDNNYALLMKQNGRIIYGRMVYYNSTNNIINFGPVQTIIGTGDNLDITAGGTSLNVRTLTGFDVDRLGGNRFALAWIGLSGATATCSTKVIQFDPDTLEIKVGTRTTYASDAAPVTAGQRYITVARVDTNRYLVAGKITDSINGRVHFGLFTINDDFTLTTSNINFKDDVDTTSNQRFTLIALDTDKTVLVFSDEDNSSNFSANVVTTTANNIVFNTDTQLSVNNLGGANTLRAEISTTSCYVQAHSTTEAYRLDISGTTIIPVSKTAPTNVQQYGRENVADTYILTFKNTFGLTKIDVSGGVGAATETVLSTNASGMFFNGDSINYAATQPTFIASDSNNSAFDKFRFFRDNAGTIELLQNMPTEINLYGDEA